MTTWAIIPVKPLHDSKRRLAHLLSVDERADLILTFLDNLLLTLNATPGLDHTLVVTGDPAVAALAAKYGAELLLEASPVGLNAAVTRGAAHAAAAGASAVLVLPADLPFVGVADVEAMLRPLTADRRPPPEQQPERLSPTDAQITSVCRPLLAVCGDEADEGTNALLLAPPGDFTFHYGPGSFRAHLTEAVEQGRSTHAINAPGLRFDLDTESDWLVYCGLPVASGG